MAKLPTPNNIVRPRIEPAFEGDRKWRELRNVEAQEAQEAEYPITRTGGPADYAQPDVRALSNLEAEVAQTFTADPEYKKPPERPEHIGEIGNSTGLKKAMAILETTVTKAHEAACQAIDDQIEEARDLYERIKKGGEAHKARLREAGQTAARNNGAAIQELLRTAEWYEKQAPNLREPKLETPKED
jgi:hypothetical protein